jgi:hypothetical protein
MSTQKKQGKGTIRSSSNSKIPWNRNSTRTRNTGPDPEELWTWGEAWSGKMEKVAMQHEIEELQKKVETSELLLHF